MSCQFFAAFSDFRAQGQCEVLLHCKHFYLMSSYKVPSRSIKVEEKQHDFWNQMDPGSVNIGKAVKLSEPQGLHL